MSSRPPEDVIKTFSKRLQDVAKTSSKYLQNVFKTSSRRLQDIFKTSSKRFEGVFRTFSRCIIKLNCSCKHVFKISSDIFKTFLRRTLKTLIDRRISLGHTSEKFMVSVKNLQEREKFLKY